MSSLGTLKEKKHEKIYMYARNVDPENDPKSEINTNLFHILSFHLTTKYRSLILRLRIAKIESYQVKSKSDKIS